MKANKSILFITVTFPPRLSVASLRIYNYAKLFSENGWKVNVLTCSQKGEEKSDEFDLSGLNIIDVKWNDPFDFTHKINNKVLRRFIIKLISFFIPYLASWWPDIRFRNWRKNTIIQANELIQKEQITHVYSSFSPPSPHMIAYDLKKNNNNLFWIAEFRDLMSFSYNLNLFQKQFKSIHFIFEKKLLSRANEIICVSKGQANLMEKKLTRPVNILLNGCDFSLYNPIKPKTNSIFTITYTGFIPKKKYDIEIFFNSISFLVKSKQLNIKVQFVGTFQSSYLLHQIQINKLIDNIIFLPRMNHKEIKRIQKSSNLLLHFCWNNKHEKGVLSGKIFEYISARVPILSVGEEIEVKSILNETQSGETCNSVEEINNYIAAIYKVQPKLIKLNDSTCKYSKLNQFKTLESRILSLK